jgi:hypothetical protein
MDALLCERAPAGCNRLNRHKQSCFCNPLLLLLLLQVSMLVAGAAAGEEAAALQELRLLLQDHQHTAPFESSPSGGGGIIAGACDSCRSVLEVAQDNIAALERSLEGWEARVRGRHTPSRVLKWASTGRTPALPK